MMARDILVEAVDEVEAAGERATGAEVGDRLARLADLLRSQAERDGTPALGALDRIQHALREVADRTDDERVADHAERARDRIFSFLGTLDDRGMKQHGLPTETDPDDRG